VFNASSPCFIASSLHHFIASSLHRFIPVNTIEIQAEIAIKQDKIFQYICKGKDDDVFRLYYGNYSNNKYFLEIVNGIHHFIASSLHRFIASLH
jgi:hypothetical protein